MQQAERGISGTDGIDRYTIVILTKSCWAWLRTQASSNRSALPTTSCARACRGIADIITIPGIINRDFADVKAIMAGMGYAVMGTATARRRATHDGGGATGHCLARCFEGGSDRRRPWHSSSTSRAPVL